jgi:hypothetical protein
VTENELRLYRRFVGADPPHASPLEHVATLTAAHETAVGKPAGLGTATPSRAYRLTSSHHRRAAGVTSAPMVPDRTARRPRGRVERVYRDDAESWRAAEKVVYSRTLQTVSSERTRIEREFGAAAIRQLKESSRSDIAIGGAELAGQAIAEVGSAQPGQGLHAANR